VRASRRAQVEAEASHAIAHREMLIEQERTRIARDMHDVVAHSLAVVIAQADGARYARASDAGAVDTALLTIAATARSALGDVRVLLAQLRADGPVGPQPGLVDLETLYAQLRASGLRLRVQQAGAPGDLPAGQQLAIYRIVQEALTNALRHGDRSADVRVRLAWTPDAVELGIRNDLPAPAVDKRYLPAEASSASDVDGDARTSEFEAGQEARTITRPTLLGHRAVASRASGTGHGPWRDRHTGDPLVHPAAGHGLAGMRERALLAGGTFTTSASGGRFSVSVTLPRVSASVTGPAAALLPPPGEGRTSAAQHAAALPVHAEHEHEAEHAAALPVHAEHEHEAEHETGISATALHAIHAEPGLRAAPIDRADDHTPQQPWLDARTGSGR